MHFLVPNNYKIPVTPQNVAAKALLDYQITSNFIAAPKMYAFLAFEGIIHNQLRFEGEKKVGSFFFSLLF